MKVIDLVVKIANGEIPEHIRYNDLFMTYDKKRQNYYDSFGAEIDWKYTIMQYLNDEVEIIEDTSKEDKKIEKIKDYRIFKTMGLDCKYNERKEPKNYSLEEKEIVDKINEVIDKINGE